MANRNNEMSLKKFKIAASKALKLERERTELENQLLSALKPNRVLRDPLPDKKCTLLEKPLSSEPPTSSKKPMLNVQSIPSSQQSVTSQDQTTSRPYTISGDIQDNDPLEDIAELHRSPDSSNTKINSSSISKSNSMPLGARRLPDEDMYQRRSLEDEIHPRRPLDEQLYQRHPLEEQINQHRTQDEHVYQRRSMDDRMQQRYSQEDNAHHRRRVKKVHQNAHQQVRAATAAAAAAAATVVAQLRKDAIDAVARQQAPYMRMAALSSAASKPSNGAHSYRGGHKEQRRVIRNSNLLSSALSIVREMDPAFLETLCYAIHDQVTKDEASDSE